MRQHTRGFTRRTFLRGAGACVALPYLESLAFAASGSAQPPLRLGLLTVTGGTVSESFVPKEVGPLGKLPSILRALEPHKQELLVLSNLSHAGSSQDVNAHQHCAYMHLTGADQVSNKNGQPITLVGSGQAPRRPAPSVDQRAAELVPAQSLIPSLEIGYAGGETAFCFRSNGANVPFEKDPRIVFNRMFKARPLVAPNWSRRAAAAASGVALPPAADTYDKQVVDLVLADARRLNKSLGSGDRRKLEEYLSSLDGIERRIVRTQERLALEAADAADPGPTAPMHPENLPIDMQASDKLVNLVPRNPAYHAEYIRLMVDLQVLAFQTDTTRVCTIGVGSDEALFPGVVTVGFERHAHTLEHQGNADRIENADPICREACRQIHAWYTQFFGYLIERMRGIDEGGSSLLDNCLLVYTSYMANGGHGTQDYPVVLAGGGGSFRRGRHIAYQKDTPMANLYVELLARMGDTAGEFGNSRTSAKAAYNGRLPDLV
ncbi:MAG TPA: DUF1552 domain-containing protein [Pirellulales bacterium]|jgi:hypothetical protein|nr:DUF1552 domain-containing protein [Pirellulales bacterium]